MNRQGWAAVGRLARLAFDPRVLREGWKALRPFSLVIAGFSCILGAVLAFRDGSRDWLTAAAALLAGLCLQAGVNLVNDFFEFKHAHEPASGSRSPMEWLIFGAGLAAMAAAGPIGLFIAWRSGWPVLLFGLVGFAGGYAYTGEPLNYKRRGLGVPLVFFLMGVLMIVGTYYALRKAFSWETVPASLPLSFLVSLILLANELRDEERDRRLGIRTLTVRIGYRRSLLLYFLLLAAAYGSAVLLRAFGLLPHLRFLFFALPFAVPPTVLAFREPARRTPIIPWVMLHHFVFGSLNALTYVFP